MGEEKGGLAGIIMKFCFFIFSRVVVVFSSILFVHSQAVASEGKDIELIAFKSAPLINCDGSGMGERIVKMAFQKQGYSLKISCYPRKRAISYFEHAHGDGIIGVSRVFSQDELYNEAVVKFKVGFVYNKLQHPELVGVNHVGLLKGKIIGAALGSSMVDDFKSMGLSLDESTTIENNIKKLNVGRVDLVYISEMSAKYLLEKLCPERVNEFNFIDYKIEQGDILFRKDEVGTKLQHDYKEGLAAIIATKEYSDIVNDFN